MPETLIFPEVDIAKYGPEQLYKIGAVNDPELGTKDGVIVEMARAFDYDLTGQPDVQNMREFIGKIGSDKETQDSVEHIKSVLGNNAVNIARDWANRSGLLLPVERLYTTVEQPNDREISLILITGGVRNWMMRRVKRAIDFAHDNGNPHVIMVGGNRKMKAREGDDFEPGITEADFLGSIAKKALTDAGVESSLVRVPGEKSEFVMHHATMATNHHFGPNERIAMVSNAGAWAQNAGQFRRVARLEHKGFDYDGQQLLVVSDGFELGTGVESTATHQNPFSILPLIAHGAREFLRQY